MQVDDIRRLVKLVEESDIEELEVRRWWEFLRITKRARSRPEEGSRAVVAVAAPVAPAPAPMPPPPAAEPPRPAPSHRVAEAPGSAPAAPAAAPAGDGDDGLVAIRSPMVGTFYRAPSPTAAPYVEIGSRVAVRQAVCIVEAMKLMNEIESEVAGTLEKILVENGKPVEYNQPMFLVRPD
jgi:acetyl-CoA carboxylase biotin carboxyl carrier protein